MPQQSSSTGTDTLQPAAQAPVPDADFLTQRRALELQTRMTRTSDLHYDDGRREAELSHW